MSLHVANVLVVFVTTYIALGLFMAIPFAVWGVSRIDPLAAGAPWSFRLLIVPGTAVFWPLLLVRWITGSVAPPTEMTAHRLRARRES